MDQSLMSSGKIVNRSGWWLPKTDTHFLQMARKGTYQRHLLLIALSCCRSWRVAVDVGAHVGFMSSDLLRFFDDVYAFEPHPTNYRCLKKNLPRVHAAPVALGAEKKSVSLHNPAMSNSGAWEITEGDFVKQKTLDAYNFPVLDFLKIDVQGAEVDVLTGARKTLERLQPTVLAECYQNNVPNYEIQDFMVSLGYKAVIRVKHDVVFLPKEVYTDLELL
jgi:FkbM family methyltransferase